MNDAIRNALIQIKRSEAAIAKAERFITDYEEFSGEKTDRDAFLSGGNEKSNPHNPQERMANLVTRANNPKRIVDVAEKVIRDAGRPIQRGDLVAAIEATGLEIFSEDKPRYIGTLLWRNKDRFENIEGEGYVLTSMKPSEGTYPDNSKPSKRDITGLL